MALNLYHFIQKLLGLAYIKEVNQYVREFTDKTNKTGTPEEKLELLKKVRIVITELNRNLGDHKITLGSGTTPKEILDHVNSSIHDLINDEATQHTFFKAFVGLIKDKNEALNSIQPINNHHIEFAKSLFEFSDYVSLKKLATIALKDTIDKKAIIKELLNGLFKWFKQTSGWFFIGLLMFAVGWLAATLSAIVTKIIRKKRELKGGGWLIFWAWFMPVLGFVFYPIISFSYILRKKA